MALPGSRKPAKRANRRLARAVSSYLTPASVAASIFALWCLASDLKLTGRLAIPESIFSRWQVWMGVAVGFQFLASMLKRYGRRDGSAMP